MEVSGEGIDLNRGVSKRTHSNGMQVCMYKDAPGIYYDVNGNELSDDFAEDAGFDIEQMKKESEKSAKLKAARLKIEKEYAALEGEIIGESGDYDIVCHDEGKNQYNVCVKGLTTPKNKVYLSKDQAIEFAKSLKGGSNGS